MMGQAITRVVAGLLLACGLSGAAQAQDADGTALCPSPRAGEALLEGIRFDGAPSGYLSAAALQSISVRVRSCPVGRTDPGIIAAAVNALYDQVPAPLALARPRGIQGNQVVLELTEITYGAVKVQGNDTTDSAYVIARSGARTGGLANLYELDRRLSAFPEIEDIRVDAALDPGAAVGTSDLTLSVTEPPRISSTVLADNYGSPFAGRARVTGNVVVRSLTGRRDPLSLGATLSEGARSVSLAYATPIGADGARLNSFASFERSKIVNGSPALIGQTSQTLTAGMIFSFAPLRADESGVDIFSLGVSGTDDQSTLGGVRLLDQRGGEVSLSYRGVKRIPGKAILSADLELAFGRYHEAILNTRTRYVRLGFSLSAAILLSENANLISTLSGQVANATLPSARRLSVAGPTGVRGYDAAFAPGSGDSGFVWRTEVARSTPMRAGVIDNYPYMFFDVGQSRTHAARPNALLAGAGAGLRSTWQMDARRTLNADVWIGTPLRSSAATRRGDVFIGVGIGASF